MISWNILRAAAEVCRIPNIALRKAGTLMVDHFRFSNSLGSTVSHRRPR